MADDLVFKAISDLQSLYHKEVNLLNIVNQQRKTLESKLTFFRCVLLDAEEKHLAGTSHAVNNLLQKLKNFVYELDDILDDCSTEDARDEYEGNRSCSFLEFLHPEKIKFRHNINDKMKAMKETLESIAEEKEQLSFFQAVNPAFTHGSNISAERETTSVIVEDESFGREQEKDSIVHRLLEDISDADPPYVYPIFGIGGLGKTTLARNVYNDERVKKHFGLMKWICVSEKYHLHTLLRSITASNDFSDSLEVLGNKLKSMLEKQRYFIVFDDLWEEDEEKWRMLKGFLRCGSRGSAILVTTRQQQIATMVQSPSSLQPHNLAFLSDEDCWKIIRKRAFGLSIGEKMENLVRIGKQIAEKCKGVPLAAIALGGLLSFRTDETSWLQVRDSQLWNLFKLGNKKEDPVFGPLKLSYLNLPAHVRPCFSYCAVYPKDTRIWKESLIQLWAANGFISTETNPALELEDIGDMIVNELYWRSLIQDIERDDETGSIVSFQLHDLVHDLAQYITGHEIHVVESGTSINLSPSMRHVSFSSAIEFTAISDSLKSCKSLQSSIFGRSVDLDLDLDVQDSTLPDFSAIWSSLQQTCLKALDWSMWNLSRVNVLQELPRSIRYLKHLRYLNLSYSDIRKLPQSVGSLWNLQTLILRGCANLEALPMSVGRLKNLRHLRTDGCPRLRGLPRSIGALTSLRTLVPVMVGERQKEEFQLSGLKHMNQLRGELEILQLERARDVNDAKEANLKDRRDLRVLSLEWDWNSDWSHNLLRGRDSIFEEGLWQTDSKILEALRPPSELRHLQLLGYQGGSFADWMMKGFLSSFKGLHSLFIDDCRNCTQLPPWWRLPSLKALQVSDMPKVRCLIDTDEDSHPQECGAFRSLEFISLDNLTGLEKMISREEADQEMNHNIMIMARLSFLSISSCPKMNSFSPCAPSLRFLRISKSETIVMSMFTPTPASCSFLQSLHTLEELYISHCESLESFPDQMLLGLTSLRELHIEYCGKLKILPEFFQSLRSLEVLEIDSCPDLAEFSSGILQMASLRELTLKYLSLESLDATIPESLTVLPAIKLLALIDFPNLASLPNWMAHLLSLQKLEIRKCPRLKSIPDSIQQLSKLENLEIIGCPELELRCKRDGQDWHKIAHVQDVEVSRFGV